jgi:hypothetical protein
MQPHETPALESPAGAGKSVPSADAAERLSAEAPIKTIDSRGVTIRFSVCCEIDIFNTSFLITASIQYSCDPHRVA